MNIEKLDCDILITTPVDEAGLKAEIEPDEPEDVGKEPPKLKLNIKKLLAPVSIGVVALTLIIGTAGFVMVWFNEFLGIEEEELLASIELGEQKSHDLPVIKVDLKTGQCKSPFLRAQVAIQLSRNNLDRAVENQDLIME